MQEKEKLLSEWTLADCQTYCSAKFQTSDGPCEASGCLLYDRGICSREWCSEWDLTDVPLRSEESINDAKAIIHITGFAWVSRDLDGRLFAWAREPERVGDEFVGSGDFVSLREDLLYALRRGQKESLQNIVGRYE